MEKDLLFKDWIYLEDNIGHEGSENGEILLDHELPHLSRITIEKKINLKNRNPYYAITVGVYGIVVHTAYFATFDDAKESYNALRLIIQAILFSQENNSSNQ